MDHKGDILLLGASGRLGRMLRRFWPQPDELICQSRQARPGFITFDPLVEREKILDAARDVRAVICLAGVTPPADIAEFAQNTDLALAAVDAATDAHVFLTSSAAVYGRGGGRLAEDTVCTPVSPYGTAKLQMEVAVLKQVRDTGKVATVLRIGNVAGADAILGGWRNGMQLDQLPNDRTPSRSYIGPKTLSRVIHALTLVSDLPEILNITAPGSVQMGDLLDAAELPWTLRPAPPQVIGDVTLCTRLLERYVSFDAKDSTADGLVSEWRAFQAQE